MMDIIYERITYTKVLISRCRILPRFASTNYDVGTYGKIVRIILDWKNKNDFG